MDLDLFDAAQRAVSVAQSLHNTLSSLITKEISTPQGSDDLVDHQLQPLFFARDEVFARHLHGA